MTPSSIPLHEFHQTWTIGFEPLCQRFFFFNSISSHHQPRANQLIAEYLFMLHASQNKNHWYVIKETIGSSLHTRYYGLSKDFNNGSWDWLPLSVSPLLCICVSAYVWDNRLALCSAHLGYAICNRESCRGLCAPCKGWLQARLKFDPSSHAARVSKCVCVKQWK